ncbi:MULTISPECIES: DNA-binding transcriptional regulator Fis [Zhongshania]|jgi:Fis family transcriptional regulator|nr:DNA-binding transcriptional regulator Fis [Zhongshania sp.]EIF44917.1 DNA-binding protein Fis [gamma proteobacterium BDW918]MBB5188684.1 Fis family transcriptional regulator [Zhongshania antarctica]|tara:strand:+ start:22359 stop:22667 length:309 start_codon:yes stop_codon:yes gene_type:complete
MNLTSTDTAVMTEVSANPTPSADDISKAKTLRDSVAIALNNYLTNLDGQDVCDVYNMVLSEVEAPLLEEVMRYTRNNQTRASQMLGLNRGTLRKKLKQYDLL